jgi:hypothetical protein
MTPEDFRRSVSAPAPPPNASRLLQALWHDAKGDWSRAHEIVQSQKGKSAAAVHAYLHRKEGDYSNADYWYERAGSERPKSPLDREWEALVKALLGAKDE